MGFGLLFTWNHRPALRTHYVIPHVLEVGQVYAAHAGAVYRDTTWEVLLMDDGLRTPGPVLVPWEQGPPMNRPLRLSHGDNNNALAAIAPVGSAQTGCSGESGAAVEEGGSGAPAILATPVLFWGV